MKRINHGVLETEVYPPDADGDTQPIRVTIEYNAWEDPGRFTGPPEDCYPPDGELEITKVTVEQDVMLPGLTDDAIVQYCQDSEEVRQLLWEDFYETLADGPDLPEPDPYEKEF